MRTVHQILDISQIEAGTYRYTPTTLDFNKLIDQSVLELTQPAREKTLALTFQSSVAEAVIEADEYALTQAVSNLIDNAVKYTERGQVQVSLISRNENLILEIQDSGIGIDKAYLGNLYDVFSQESTGYTKKYQGIGLGLALTKRYLDLHGIKVDVKSKKNVGTTFTLTIPATKRKRLLVDDRSENIFESVPVTDFIYSSANS